MTIEIDSYLDCINPNLDHSWEFDLAEFGSSVYVCKLCGRYVHELEDSLP